MAVLYQTLQFSNYFFVQDFHAHGMFYGEILKLMLLLSCQICVFMLKHFHLKMKVRIVDSLNLNAIKSLSF